MVDWRTIDVTSVVHSSCGHRWTFILATTCDNGGTTVRKTWHRIDYIAESVLRRTSTTATTVYILKKRHPLSVSAVRVYCMCRICLWWVHHLCSNVSYCCVGPNVTVSVHSVLPDSRWADIWRVLLHLTGRNRFHSRRVFRGRTRGQSILKSVYFFQNNHLEFCNQIYLKSFLITLIIGCFICCHSMADTSKTTRIRTLHIRNSKIVRITMVRSNG
jgi:hypothetical protein